MLKRLSVALALLAATVLAHATAPTTQSIERLLILAHAEKVLDVFKPGLQATLKAGADSTFKGRKPSAEEQKVFDEYVLKATQIANDMLTMERLTPLYVELYAKYFTQEEVDGMIAFYQSPAGQSMITKMPQLTQGLMAALPGFLAPMAEAIKAAEKQLSSDLQALKAKAP